MENDFREINYLGDTVEILKYESESENQFNSRLEFIKKLENKSVNWKEAQRLSKVWYGINYKQCKYQPGLYHTVMSYDK